MAASKQKAGLGRGFGTLLPQNFDSTILVDAAERVQQLAITDVEPNAEQPRKLFDESALQELAASIKEHGIVQPLIVSLKGGTYVIIAGERRWRAAQIAGLKRVPVIVRTAKDLEQLEIALIENVQRVDLTALEQAVSIERLHQQFNASYESIAKRLGKAISTVHNIARLLQLPDDAKAALTEQKITEGHARQILALKGNPDKQAELLKLIMEHSWSVRQAERYVSSIKQGFVASKTTVARVSVESRETRQLSKRYGTPVKLYRTAKGGRLEIVFSDDEQLEHLLRELDR